MSIDKKKIIIKVIYFIFTVLIFPLIVTIIVHFSTKERVEVTFKLDNYSTLGYIKESNLPLSMTWEGKPIRNIMKISWIVENTGTKGIEYFEQDPVIFYPMNLVVVSSTITNTSPRLLINKKILIDPKKSNISLGEIGVLNPKDFFCVVTYITDFNESEMSPEFFKGWNLEAKAVDLNVKKEITTGISKAENEIDKKWLLIAYLIGVIVATLSYYRPKIMKYLKYNDIIKK
ncbi:MAG: hypothetical protein FVQ85_17680 [Planctomycetes bacterium]|nr:hypothetical protein [Planctomycetota bacterium]